MISEDGMILQCGLSACIRAGEEAKLDSHVWYWGRTEIKDLSPSRTDGISAEEECYRRISYSMFTQELGKRLLL